MYFLICFFCLYVLVKTSLSTIIYILDTHLFSNFVTMEFIYDACYVYVQTHKNCMFFSIDLVVSTESYCTGYIIQSEFLLLYTEHQTAEL